MLFILYMIISITILFVFIVHPVVMVIILVVMSTLVSMVVGVACYSYWFSYMLFLVMVGGMLIVFIYMTSIASNEKLLFDGKVLLTSISAFPLLMVSELLFNDLFGNTTSFFWKAEETSMLKYINYPSMMIVFMMIVYLLIALIAVVKIVKFDMGPLRQKY